jgi:hypothetical protein
MARKCSPADKYVHYAQSLRFRGKAINLLKKNIASKSRQQEDSTLASILMLTLTDMCIGGRSDYSSHIKGARWLMGLRGTKRTRGGFVEQFIAWYGFDD